MPDGVAVSKLHDDAHVQVTILVDNQAGEGLVSEHGLSMWIETED